MSVTWEIINTLAKVPVIKRGGNRVFILTQSFEVCEFVAALMEGEMMLVDDIPVTLIEVACSLKKGEWTEGDGIATVVKEVDALRGLMVRAVEAIGVLPHTAIQYSRGEAVELDDTEGALTAFQHIALILVAPR